jgi:ketosteroid isomerase-like protein
MSQGNFDVVLRLFDVDWARSDLDATMQLIHDDAELDWSNSRAPYQGVYRGRAEIADAWRTWKEAWEEWYGEVREVIEVDPDTVVMVTRVRARGKGSGVTVHADGASVWSVRDGKIFRGKLFQSKAAALESMGVPLQDSG